MLKGKFLGMIKLFWKLHLGWLLLDTTNRFHDKFRLQKRLVSVKIMGNAKMCNVNKYLTQNACFM